MKALSLFSGIGGIDLACEWAGIETVAFCEREPFPQKVLRKHWPDIPIYNDVCTLTKERLDADGIGTIDLIHGGYPCQPFSVAGKREGKEDDRHLWPEVFRLIQTIKPRWFVGENVAGHVTLGIDIVLADLGSIDYAWESFVIPAVAINARHRRDRVFIVAYPISTRRTEQFFSTVNDQKGRDRRGDNPQDVPDTNSVTRLEAYKTLSSIGKGWKPRNYVGGLHWGETSRFDREVPEPAIFGMVDGVSTRLDPYRRERLKALGNAVVPAQIFPIMAAIKQIDDMMRTV